MLELGSSGSGVARLAAIPAGASARQHKESSPCCSHIQRQGGRPNCRKPGSKSPLGPGDRSDPTKGGKQPDRPQRKQTGKPRNTCPAGSGLRELWECRAAQISAKAMSASETGP